MPEYAAQDMHGEMGAGPESSMRPITPRDVQPIASKHLSALAIRISKLAASRPAPTNNGDGGWRPGHSPLNMSTPKPS